VAPTVPLYQQYFSANPIFVPTISLERDAGLVQANTLNSPSRPCSEVLRRGSCGKRQIDRDLAVGAITVREGSLRSKFKVYMDILCFY
jgi:hypothetical protein